MQETIVWINDDRGLWCHMGVPLPQWVNTLRPRQNRCHFADDIFKSIFLNENARISLKISLKFVPKVGINNTPALVQIMASRRPGDKPLSEPMMVILLTHICFTRPQWVKWAILWLVVPQPYLGLSRLASQAYSCRPWQNGLELFVAWWYSTELIHH